MENRYFYDDKHPLESLHWDMEPTCLHTSSTVLSYHLSFFIITMLSRPVWLLQKYFIKIPTASEPLSNLQSTSVFGSTRSVCCLVNLSVLRLYGKSPVFHNVFPTEVCFSLCYITAHATSVSPWENRRSQLVHVDFSIGNSSHSSPSTGNQHLDVCLLKCSTCTSKSVLSFDDSYSNGRWSHSDQQFPSFL